MLPRDPLAIPPVARTLAAGGVEAIGDPRQQAFQRALAGQLGKSMQGEVLARLTDGSFVVRVAGTPARMQLPAGAQPGAEIPLTLVALTPRPTFQVGPDGQAPATFTEAHAALPGFEDAGAATARAPLSRAAALLANAPLTPSAQLAGVVADDGSPASLSSAARAIGSMLGAALKADGATAIIGHAPLAGAPGADPQQLAAALKGAIGGSGLFYESHVAEWAAGGRTLAELAAEPQMQAARAGAGRADAAGAQLVNLQLATHEQGQLAWQGQAWPGQPLRLEIGRDAPDRQRREGSARGDADDAGGSWQSRLRLRFPLLGEVAASIALSGDQVHVRLEAGSQASGELLRAHAARLTGSLEAAGAPLSSLAIGAAKDADD